MFSYLSYRDPNLLGTVDVYDGTPEFLRSLHLSNDELTKAIIGTIGDMDAYQLPDAKGYTAFLRHVLGVQDEERQVRPLCNHWRHVATPVPTQIRREQILGTTIKDFHEFADVLDAIRKNGKVVAVTSAERVQAANEERDGFFSSVRKML